MVQVDREDVITRLQTLRADLLKLLRQSSQGAEPISLDQPIGRLSRMDALQQQSMTQANRRATAQRLEQVDAALQRLDRGDYGLCLACEEDIPADRLRVRPEAALCITCQRSREGR